MGNWRPDRVQLDDAGEHVWRKRFQFKPGAIIEYKITHGSWDNEAVDEKGFQRGKDYFRVQDKDARHFEAARAKRTPGALKLFFWCG